MINNTIRKRLMKNKTVQIERIKIPLARIKLTVFYLRSYIKKSSHCASDQRHTG